MQTQTNGKNGHNGHNGHLLSIDQIKKKLNQLRRPGRPSQEVLGLRAQLKVLEGELIDNIVEDVMTGPKKRTSKIKLDRSPTPVEEPPVKEKKKTKKQLLEEDKQSRKAIYIPPIVQEVIEVDIVGISDLIQHAWDPKTIRQMEDDQQKKVGDPKTKSRHSREPRSPNDEYRSARYIRNGKDCLPVVQFKKCMTSAASQLRGVTMKNINTAVFVKSTNAKDFNFAPLKFAGKEPAMRTDMVKIGKFPNKTATPRYRPGYSNWRCTIRVEFDASIISAEQIVNLLNRGGFGVGIAEWRPERGGEFGRFEVKAVRGVR